MEIKEESAGADGLADDMTEPQAGAIETIYSHWEAERAAVSSNGLRQNGSPGRETEAYGAVISGGSAAGLSLALALADASAGQMRIALVERSWPPMAIRGDVRAYAFSAASRHMLTVLQVWDEIAPVAQEVRRIEITDSSLNDGVRPVILTYDNATETGEPATHIVPGEAIVAALAESGGRLRG